MPTKNIGDHVRQSRKVKKMTLVELAEKTGVAQATLSRIETGVMTGTLESHERIAEALELTLPELYGGLDIRRDKTILKRQSKLTPEVRSSQKVHVELLTQEAMKKKMTPLLITLAGKTRMKPEQCERGIEKFIFALEGTINVSIDKDAYVLKQHDSLYFDASLKHAISNPASKKARLFCVVSPPKI